MLEATYQPTYHYLSANAQSFRHLDLEFDDRTAHGLRTKRFRSLADVEDTSITKVPSAVLALLLVRPMLSRDSMVIDVIEHPRMKNVLL